MLLIQAHLRRTWSYRHRTAKSVVTKGFEIRAATSRFAHPSREGGLLGLMVQPDVHLVAAQPRRSSSDRGRWPQLPPGEEPRDAYERHHSGDDKDGAEPGYRGDLA